MFRLWVLNKCWCRRVAFTQPECIPQARWHPILLLCGFGLSPSFMQTDVILDSAASVWSDFIFTHMLFLLFTPSTVLTSDIINSINLNSNDYTWILKCGIITCQSFPGLSTVGFSEKVSCEL